MNNNPIGIFDSGVGGLSVWKELIKELPNESIIYYADSANCPYGNKSQEDIIALSQRIVDFFIEQNVKLIVVACNTATAAAIDYLRKTYSLSFVGMEPAIKPAAQNTKNGIVGILATEGTFGGRLFLETSQKWASNVEVVIQVGEGFVELVENGDFTSDLANKTVSDAVQPLIDKGIDHLVLACTHYPFLCENIKAVSKNKQLEIINPAPAVALQVKSILEKENLESNTTGKPIYNFYSSGNLKILKLLVNKIYSGSNTNFIESKLKKFIQ